MKVINKSYLISAIIIVFIGFILTPLYRPIIYSINFNDLGIADSIGSLIPPISFCFFVWGFKEYTYKEKDKQIIVASLVFSFGWEALGLLGIHGTFDKKDILLE